MSPIRTTDIDVLSDVNPFCSVVYSWKLFIFWHVAHLVLLIAEQFPDKVVRIFQSD